MALFDGIGPLRASLDYHLARQNLLTANLTHIDTPGYRPVDLSRASFRGELSVAMQATAPGHIAHAPQGKTEGFRIIHPASPAGLDGNGVSVDAEAVKIATNQLRYDAVASLTTAQLSGLAWAANDGR
jgi:flagellar basal-body rod protein FlgB